MKKIITSVLAVIAAAGIINAQEEVITLDLNSPTNPEELNFTDADIWVHTYNETDYQFFEFTPFAFSHLMTGEEGASYGGYYWDGFTISRNSGKSGWQGNAAGGGLKIDGDKATLDASEPYIIGYWPEYLESSDYHPLTIMFDDGQNYRAKGVWVNNDAEALSNVTNGNGYARKFDKEGDSFTLVFHGVAPDDSEKTVEVELAAFKDGTLSANTDWTYVDLSPLGRVESIYCTMTSTDVSSYGINTACYFALAGLQVTKPLPTAIEAIDSQAPVLSVKYYNVAGVEATQPHDGVNIVITTRADGSRSVSKIIR